MPTYRRTNRVSKPRRPRSERMSIETTFDSGMLDEPSLLFGGHHRHIDPKTGLALYGPYSVGREEQNPLRSITVGIIGTTALVFKMKNLLRKCQGIVTNDGSSPFSRPPFPGINHQSPFECTLFFGETWQEIIDEDQLAGVLRISDYWQQLEGVINLYTDAFERLSQREPRPNVVICLIPEEIDASLHSVTSSISEFDAKSETEDAVEEGEVNEESETRPNPKSPFNVRRALKAAFMRFEIPTQLVRGSTLGLSLVGQIRQKQDDATLAWNLIAGIYYKAGSHLWRLPDLQPGTCFVGISFYRERFGDKPSMRTSIAQIFTHTGDGLILRGRSFEWNRAQGPSPHLQEDFAEELLAQAIKRYTSQAHNKPPTRLVVHKSSRFEAPELRGFQNAIGSEIPKWDFVAIEKRGIQFFRQGYHSPLRGTWVEL